MLLYFHCMKYLCQQCKHIKKNSATIAKLVICPSLSISLRRRGIQLPFICSAFVPKPNDTICNLNLEIHSANFSSQLILLDIGGKKSQYEKLRCFIGKLKFNYLHKLYQTTFLWEIGIFHIHNDSAEAGL